MKLGGRGEVEGAGKCAVAACQRSLIPFGFRLIVGQSRDRRSGAVCTRRIPSSARGSITACFIRPPHLLEERAESLRAWICFEPSLYAGSQVAACNQNDRPSSNRGIALPR